MKRLFRLALIVLLLPLAAQAPPPQRWFWFPISGGAVAYDEASRYVDIGGGIMGINTVTYYQQPRAGPAGAYSFLAERLEFECRGNRYRWSKSAVLDKDGHLISEREDGLWMEMTALQGAAALYRRMLCNAEQPPQVNRVASIDLLYKAMTGPQPAPAAPVAAAPATTPVAAPKATPSAPEVKAATKAEPKTEPRPLDLNALAASLAQAKGQPATASPPSPEPKLRR